MSNDILKKNKKIPVILDTDIGTDIDDTWALVMLLNSPELDLKLVVTETDDTLYRAKLAAKMLEIGQRTDVPVGLGLKLPYFPATERRLPCQASWVEDYDIKNYPGTVYDDGVNAIIDTIMDSPEQVTIIGIGPVPNLAEALEREPRIADNARFVGMQGSVRRGYDGCSQIEPEFNLRRYLRASQKVFSAGWDITITPVDTCDMIRLVGEKYRRVYNCQTPLVKALIENYKLWAPVWEVDRSMQGRFDPHHHRIDPTVESTFLFDTVAVYLAINQDLVVMEDLGIRVTDEALTMIDERAKVIHCATAWKDLEGFEDFLVDRITRTA